MTILWLIERLLVKPTEGSNTDVVITADWRCNGTDETYSGTCYGSCSFAPPTGSFTPYADLTEQQVLDWVSWFCLRAEMGEGYNAACYCN